MVLTDQLFSVTDQLFSDKRKFKDTIQIKKKEDILIITSFIPSNMNFQTIMMPKVNLAKMLSKKNWSVRTILILSMLLKILGVTKRLNDGCLVQNIFTYPTIFLCWLIMSRLSGNSSILLPDTMCSSCLGRLNSLHQATILRNDPIWLMTNHHSFFPEITPL